MTNAVEIEKKGVTFRVDYEVHRDHLRRIVSFESVHVEPDPFDLANGLTPEEAYALLAEADDEMAEEMRRSREGDE